MIQHPARLPEPVGHLADDIEPRRPQRRQAAGGAVPPCAHVFQQLDAGRLSQPLVFAGWHLGGAEQRGGADRRERVHRRVVGEDAGQEQGDVTEPPVDARTVAVRDAVEHPGQPDRVEFAETPRPRPAAAPDPVPPTGHAGEGREEFRQEKTPARRAKEVPEIGDIEQRHPLPQASAFRDVVQRRQFGGGPVDRHGEGQEGRHRDRWPAAGEVITGAEYRLEHARIAQQADESPGVCAQPRGIVPGVRH